MAEDSGRLREAPQSNQIKVIRHEKERQPGFFQRSKRYFHFITARIGGKCLKLRRCLRRSRTVQPTAPCNTFTSARRRHHISKATSLSVIFERNKEDAINSMEESISLLSSVSLQSMLSSSSSDSMNMSFKHSSAKEHSRSEQGRKDKMLSSLIPNENNHLLQNESLDDLSSDGSSVNFAVHVRRTSIEGRNEEGIEVSDDFTDDTVFNESCAKNLKKTLSQISVWSGDTTMSSLLENNGGENVERASEISMEARLKSSAKMEPSPCVQLVNTLINVKISNDSKDFTGSYDTSQNANKDGTSQNTKVDSTGKIGSLHDMRSRRSLQQPVNYLNFKIKDKVESEGTNSLTFNMEQRKSKVSTKCHKRVRFQEKHFVINDSYSDSALPRSEVKEQQTEVHGSGSAIENVNDEEMKESVASFVSSLLSRTLFASGKKESPTPSPNSVGQSQRTLPYESTEVVSPRTDDHNTEDDEFLIKILNVNHNWRNSENNNSNMLTIPFDLLINMVDDEKADILRTCGSRYDQGDTFKGRDIAEHRAIQDRLVRLQKLKELLRRAKVAMDHSECEEINMNWLHQYTNRNLEDQCQNTELDVQKYEDPPKIRSIYRRVNGLDKEANLIRNNQENSNNQKRPNITQSNGKLQEEYTCKDTEEFQSRQSRLQNDSSERGATETQTPPTIKQSETQRSEMTPDVSFWKDLNQGKINAARAYVKEQAPMADDMSKWKAHNLCEMYDDDLWELYRAAESSSDDCSPRSSLDRKSIVCYSEANTELNLSTAGSHTYNDRNTRTSRTDEDKKRGTGARRKTKKHKVKTKKADTEESSDDSTIQIKEGTPRKSSKKCKARFCHRKQNLDDKREKNDDKSASKLPGFLEAPLRAKDQVVGKRHSKEEENLEFFRYIARNPGFFRSGTPMPPRELDEEYSAASFTETSRREYAIDSETAADNLFFFRTVSRSSQFYSRPSSRNAEFRGN